MSRFPLSGLLFLFMIIWIRADARPDEALVNATKMNPGITISGSFQGDFRLTEYPKGQRPRAASDLYLRRMELALETELTAGISATAVLNSEWLGDPQKRGDSKVVFDEIHLDVRPSGFPGYLVIGKRALPFGIFENDMLTDPLTQDAFEIKKVGLTVGFNGPLESDLALTVYKGTEQMDHLFAANLIDTDMVERFPSIPSRVNSFILSLAASPFHQTISLFGSLLSEPGNQNHNTTLNMGFHAAPSERSPWMWVGETMLALDRELYAGASRSYREAALSTAVTYHLAFSPSSTRERQLRTNGSYRSRRSHRYSHPVSLSLRFECFLDDSMTRELNSWTLKNRMSLDGRFTFFDRENISLYGESEFRHSSYRPSSETGLPSGHLEWFIRLGADF